MYVEKICQLGADTIEICRYGSGGFGAPGKPRRKKENPTSESVRKRNKKNRARYIQRLMLCNFKAGDLSVVLQYRKEDRPKTYEEAVARLRNFLKRMRKYYKARGYACKYIAVTERGKKRAVLHHHIILEAIDENHLHTLPAISACWDGYVKASVMYEDGNFKQLAEYLVKSEGKEEAEGATYIRSRNLEEPKPEKRIVFRKTWDKDPVAPEGWYVDKSTLVNGINLYTGRPFQRYMLKRIKGAPKRPKQHQKRRRKPFSMQKMKSAILGWIRRLR